MIFAATLTLSVVFSCAAAYPVDGDTIACKAGERVRLWGVNSPEKSDPNGPAATRALSRLIAGRDLSCTVKGRPSYGRLVALCRLPDGRDIAAEMVRGGFAVDWPKFSGGAYSREVFGR